MSYVPIRVSTLRGDEKVPFDLYIQLGEKYLHYIKLGDSFEGPRLDRLKQKKLKKMFLKIEQESKYQEYITRNLDAAFSNDSKKSVETRAEIAQGASQTAVEGVMENPADVLAYKNAKDIAQKYQKFLAEKTEAVKTILGMQNIDKSLAHHGVTVATLAVTLAPQIGVTENKNLELLALGGYLHDIGHSDHEDLCAIPLAAMTPEQKAIYLKHTEAGAQKAQKEKHFDQGVIDIIMQHEELGDGSGYPQKLMEMRINKLALIVSVCNAWDRLITFENVEKNEALKRFTMEKLGKYPLDYINSLKRIVK